MSKSTSFVTLGFLLIAVISLQALRERRQALAKPPLAADQMLYVRSGEVMKHVTLSYQSLAADVYWIRAIQHYGRTRLQQERAKRYELLFPLLDLTTTLDPRFNIAYRFGAVFLAEDPPGGPGRADQAIELLQKGLRAQPDKWEFAHDIGFVHYWWRQDYASAAEWFRRASVMPHAPNWLEPLAAVTLAEGGSRDSSRQLWQEVVDNADAEWLRTQGRFRLKQLDAMDQIAALENLTKSYEQRTGDPPQSWSDLVRAGYLAGIPIDSERHPFELNPFWGTVTLAGDSPLNPLPQTSQRPR